MPTITPTTTLTPGEQLLETLRADGVITAEIAARIQDEAKKGDVDAEEIIRRDRIASEEDVAKAKGKILNIDFFDLTGKVIPVDILAIIPEQTAESFNVIPIAKEGELLEVGMVNPSDYRAAQPKPAAGADRKGIVKGRGTRSVQR